MLVVATEPPKDLSPDFTADTFTNHVVANLNKMLLEAASKDSADATRLEGIGPRPAKETIIPIRSLSTLLLQSSIWSGAESISIFAEGLE